jgi:hypothetical protein
VRSAGAVRDLSDSGLIVRLTRGPGWIAVLCALLGGIVTLNVLSLSLNAGSGRTSLQIDELKTEVSSLRAQIDDGLSAVKVEAEAARLGLANRTQGDHLPERRECERRAPRHLLATDSFLLAPSQPSSYPAPGPRTRRSRRPRQPRRPRPRPTTTTAAPTTETTSRRRRSRPRARAAVPRAAGSSGSGASSGPRGPPPEAWGSRQESRHATDRPPAGAALLRVPAGLLVRRRSGILVAGVAGAPCARRHGASRSPR